MSQLYSLLNLCISSILAPLKTFMWWCSAFMTRCWTFWLTNSIELGLFAALVAVLFYTYIPELMGAQFTALDYFYAYCSRHTSNSEPLC